MKKSLLFTLSMTLIAALWVGSLNAQKVVTNENVKPISSFSTFKTNNLFQDEEIIFSEGFEGTTMPDLPEGWSQSSPGKWGTLDNFMNHPNMTENFASHSGSLMMVAVWINSGDNWAFSPGFELEEGETYLVSFWYSDMGHEPSDEADNFEVWIIDKKMDIEELIFEQGNVLNGWDYLWKEATYTFTPPYTSTCFLGFHDLRPPTGYGLCIAIDDIEVRKISEESVNEIVKPVFTIFPNPSTHLITVSAKTSFSKVEVCNFLGQTILSQQNDSNTAQLNVSSLSSGVYFVRIISNNGTSVKKFVKQ
ncbi:MAG: T9SS type A sorting domain-containing protein [Bacteroidales bacterium]|jgi:hypothetical protein|nr:T9SS type A sorting domain-containing protein [Bacteroidales bacterium]